MKQTGLSQFGGKKGTPPWRFRGEHKTWNAELGTSSTWNGKNRTWNGVPTRGAWNGKKAELGTANIFTRNKYNNKNTTKIEIKLILHYLLII